MSDQPAAAGAGRLTDSHVAAFAADSQEVKRRTYTATEVAVVVGITSEYFRTIRRKLEANGFPGKLPGVAKWSRAAVNAWVDANGKPTPPPGATDQAIADARADLEKSYA